MGISYSKELRASAARQNKDLFACGLAEATGNGSREFIGPMDREMADALFSFASSVLFGVPPAEAFAAIRWPEHREI